MSVNSRLRNCEKSLKGRELALLWLKTSQAKGGYLEYWKTGEFQSWVSENDEAGLLYHLAIEVNGAVLMAVDGWRALELGWPAWSFPDHRYDTTVDPHSAQYGRRFPGTLTTEALRIPRRRGRRTAGGGLNFRGVF